MAIAKGLRELNLDPIDPNVKVPAAVQAQADAAAAAHAAAYGEPPPDEDSAPAGNETPPGDEATGDNGEADAPVDTPVASPPAPEDQRYRSLKGRFERLSDAVGNKDEEIQQLHNLIASMQAAKPPPPEQFNRLVTEQEEQDYGSDFLEVVAKKAREDLLPDITMLRNQIGVLTNRLGQTAEREADTAVHGLWAYLDDALPNWQEINASQEFKEWLALPDEYSGAIRQQLIIRAFNQHDAGRVLRFFNGFLAEEAANAPSDTEVRAAPAPVTPFARTNGNQPPARLSLASLAAPGRARSAAGNNPPAEKPSITTAQITQFYADVNAGRYRGRDAEKNALEAEIFAAGREGRVFR